MLLDCSLVICEFEGPVLRERGTRNLSDRVLKENVFGVWM